MSEPTSEAQEGREGEETHMSWVGGTPGDQKETASERGGNNVEGFTDFRTEDGSSPGQHLALTGLFPPSCATGYEPCSSVL